LRTFLKTGSHQHTTIGCNTHSKTTKNVRHYTSLTRLTDQACKGRVANPWGKTVLSSTSVLVYTGLLVFRSF